LIESKSGFAQLGCELTSQRLRYRPVGSDYRNSHLSQLFPAKRSARTGSDESANTRERRALEFVKEDNAYFYGDHANFIQFIEERSPKFGE